MNDREVSEAQLKFEEGCEDILRDLHAFILGTPTAPQRMLAVGNIVDLRQAIKDSYGRHDGKESS